MGTLEGREGEWEGVCVGGCIGYVVGRVCEGLGVLCECGVERVNVSVSVGWMYRVCGRECV